MSENWKTYKIEDIASKISIGPFGSRMKSDCYVDEGIPVIRGKNLGERPDFISDFVYITEKKADELLGCNVFKGDLVFPHRGAIGEVGLVTKDERFVLSSSLMKLTCDNAKADSRFVYYFFKSDLGKRRLLLNESQVGTPGIGQPLSSLRDIDINLPELPEQRSIASILSGIDDKIELNLQMNKTLEEIAMTLYKHWFVDFGPFKDGEFVDSELGMIPKGWEVKPIGDIIETLGGGTPKTEVAEYWENGTIDWYSPTDLTKANALYSLGSAKKITELGLQKSSSRLFPKGSLLMSSRATIGAITINRKDSCTNQGFITMIPNKTVSLFQLHGWTVHNMDLIISKANGSTFKEISKSNFRSLPIVVGNGIQDYLMKCKNIYDQIENNILETETLTTLRDTILPKLISGEVRVKEEKNALAEVL